MDCLNVGVVGLGLQGERHARGFWKMPLVRLAAVCDINRSKGEKLAQELGAVYYESFEEMLDSGNVDAVDISLPDNMHLNAVEAAVRHNKHILVEKPMASTREDCEKICELVKNFKKVFMIGYILRFDSRYAGAKAAVESGQIGEPVTFYTRRNSPISGPLHYKGYTDLSMHVMVHDIDALQWILKSRIVSVFAKKSGIRLKEAGMTDSITALMTFENGVAGAMEACWVLPDTSAASIDDKMEIIGSAGVIYTDSCDRGMTIVGSDRIDSPDSRHWPDLNGEVSGALYEELTYFVNCILRGEQSMITADDGLGAIKVVQAVEQSIREGKEVQIAI